jgi:TPR repeat protein
MRLHGKLRAPSLRVWAALGMLGSVAGAWAQSPDATSTQSIATLKQQAASGDATAQVNLGAAYHNGLGVPKDEAEAVHWIAQPFADLILLS